jgi:hypothetical protein
MYEIIDTATFTVRAVWYSEVYAIEVAAWWNEKAGYQRYFVQWDGAAV